MLLSVGVGPVHVTRDAESEAGVRRVQAQGLPTQGLGITDHQEGRGLRSVVYTYICEHLPNHHLPADRKICSILYSSVD